MGLAFWESVFLCHQSENRLKQHKTYNKKWQREGGLESSGQLKILRGDDGGWNEPPLCPPGALWTGRCPTHGIKAVDVVLRKLWWENLLALDLYGGPESSKRCSLDSHQRHKHWWQPKQEDINSGQQTHLCCIQCFCTWCFISPLQHVYQMLVASIFAQWPLMVLLQTTLPLEHESERIWITWICKTVDRRHSNTNKVNYDSFCFELLIQGVFGFVKLSSSWEERFRNLWQHRSEKSTGWAGTCWRRQRGKCYCTPLLLGCTNPGAANMLAHSSHWTW